MKRFFIPATHTPATDGALLLLRLVAGAAFMFHGWSKIQDPAGWMGPEPFAPAFFLVLAAVSEFGGGLAWILGLLTPLASLGIVCTMSVATWFHALHRGDPFVAKGGGPSYELALVYLVVALVVLATGPGRFALDRLLFRGRGDRG